MNNERAQRSQIRNTHEYSWFLLANAGPLKKCSGECLLYNNNNNYMETNAVTDFKKLFNLS